MNIENLVEEGLSTRQIAKKMNKSQGFVKYNLKKLGLKTKLISLKFPIINGKKICSNCKNDLPISDFYKKYRNESETQNVCKSCSNQSTSKKMIDNKIKMIEYKGGKCEKCSISLKDSHYCIFDFHHRSLLLRISIIDLLEVGIGRR